MTDVKKSSIYTLPKKVVAMQISCPRDGTTGSGVFSELPEGAQIFVFGDGFNSRTVKIKWQSQFYLVFMQDIQAS
jgi:hypothetical protein